MIIDCDSCEVRGAACGDCVVSVLLGAPPTGVEIDDSEAAALAVLAGSGLVPPLRLVAGGCGPRSSPPAQSDPALTLRKAGGQP